MRPMRRLPLRCGLLAGLLILACDGNPTEVALPPPCLLPALPAGFSAPVLTNEQVRSGLRDAGTRMVQGLGSGATVTNIAASLAQLENRIGGADAAEACASLTTAMQDLAALPDEPATRPDRTAIELVLHLTNVALRAAGGAAG
jgi:hypothetical protein